LFQQPVRARSRQAANCAPSVFAATTPFRDDPIRVVRPRPVIEQKDSQLQPAD
jgi:hypothetical protein